MKKLFIYAFVLVSSILFNNQKVQGQNTEDQLEVKKFGIGIHAEQYKISDISTDLYAAPSNKILFTFNLSSKFRLEPEFGFTVTNDKEEDTKSKSYYYGLGGFGMTQEGRTNIYYGVRVELAKLR